ncbi:MAG: tetratricopeptide repeat protein [Polyangiaceae bacterium]|nr:tetratricopeptide repeat protein [Polyangiaceae bacterium]
MAAPLVLACATCGSPPEPQTVVLEIAHSSAPERRAADASACAAASAGTACAAMVEARELAELSSRIAWADAEVKRTLFQEADLLVERARLQLRREDPSSNVEGSNDADRALKDALRALAVEPSSPRAAFVYALARVRSFAPEAPTSILRDPALRAGALRLALDRLQTLASAQGPLGAATHTLRGYLELELGASAKARESFVAATRLDPTLGSAWMGLGDVARAQGSFADAERAYLEATKLLPSDPTVAAALSAARAKAPLSVPPAGAAEAAPLSIDLSPLAAVPPPTACSTVEAGQTPELCAAVEQLIKARSKQDLEAAASSVIAAQSSLQSACQALDPRCGPHVSVALADAGRGFRAAGKTGKSVQIAKLLMQRREYFPASEEVAATAALEAADQLLQLGLFDQAADSYGAFATTNGSSAEAPAALERALRLRLLLGQREAAEKALSAVVVRRELAADLKAEYVLATARLVRVRGDRAAVVAFGKRHGALLAEAGRAGALSAIAEREPASSLGGRCETLLACAIRRLAGEPGWSPKAQAAAP